MKLLRYGALALVGLLVIGFVVPYIEIGAYRDRIQNALERALDRKVKVGKVHFNLLTGPGFTLEDVTIEDHPSIGIEPIAYVETLDARVEITSLFSRRPSFSNLRLNNPTVNLSKPESGDWNFQLLGRSAPAAAPANAQRFPSIQVRSGRINFKFGDYKTIFFLSDSDVDVTPLGAGTGLDIRFSGQPARTDQAAQFFGRLLARGVWKPNMNGPGELDMNAELERSSIPDLVRLVEGHAVGLHGTVALRARIAGPITNLKVNGQLRLEDVHRWDLSPAKAGGGWDLPYQGTADLNSQRIEIETERKPDIPFLVRFRASHYLSNPTFGASIEFNDAPVPAFLEAAGHLGATLPPGLSADGSVAGVIGFSRPGGLQGQLLVHDSHVSFQKTGAIDLRRAEFVISGGDIEILPSTVVVTGGQTAEVQGSYHSEAARFDLQVTTRAMSVAELRTGSERLLGAAGVPVLEACRQGVWRGTLHYTRDDAATSWAGQFELQNARVQVDGLDGLIRINSAQVQIDGPKVSISNIRGRAGAVAFRADYASDATRRPDRLRLDMEEVDLADIEAVVMPALRRDGGLLARFRLRSPAIPEWLRTRHVSANVKIEKLTAAGGIWAVDHVRAMWEGANVKLLGVAARQGSTEISGQVAVDLAAGAPRYSFTGKVEDAEYRGGTLNLEGSAQSRGFGPALLQAAQATGTFLGESLNLSPETEFRTISGNFDVQAGGKVRLTAVQAVQGLDAYSGQGMTQPDGKLLLELTSGKRQLRLAVAR